MAYNDDRSLEDLIADSINRKKSAVSKVKVVKIKGNTSSGQKKSPDKFDVHIDYSKSEPEFYGEDSQQYVSEDELWYDSEEMMPDSSEPPVKTAKRPQPDDFDEEFIRTLRENFGSNLPAAEKTKSRKSNQGREKGERSGGKSKRTASAQVRPVSHTESVSPAAHKKGKTTENKVKQKKKDSHHMDNEYEDTEVRKKKKILPKVIIALILLLILAVVIVFMLMDKYAGLFNYVPTKDRLDIQNVISDKEVTNVLLIGSDVRSGNSYGLSDSMILVSMDNANYEIVMTSFMRDMYVQIPGQDQETWHKLNWAHSHGGPELLMDTLEYNFGVEIDYYATVDFAAFASIIDAVGGLDITVTDAEAKAMQPPMAEQNDIFGNEYGTDYIYESGNYHMNGNQALAFSRIRKGVGDDFSRTDRQRQVIGLISEKARSMNVKELDDLAEKILPNITTNMEKKKIMKLMASLPSALKYKQVSQRIPYGEKGDSWDYGSSSSDGSIIVVDFDLNKKKLAETIYKK